MQFPQITAGYAGLLGLIYVILSMLVVRQRVRTRVHHGDGGDDRLNRLIRAHANFAEYVPLILLLAALLEAGGWPHMHWVLGPLLAARISHPIGMLTPVASPQQYALRGGAIVVTWAVLIFLARTLLVIHWPF